MTVPPMHMAYPAAIPLAITPVHPGSCAPPTPTTSPAGCRGGFCARHLWALATWAYPPAPMPAPAPAPARAPAPGPAPTLAPALAPACAGAGPARAGAGALALGEACCLLLAAPLAAPCLLLAAPRAAACLLLAIAPKWAAMTAS